MPTINTAIDHFKRYGMRHKPLYILSLMLLFWSLFDGIITYITPIVITQAGMSKTVMGIIYSSSSVAGAVFDFILCRFLKNTYYKKVFLVMFIACAIYPLFLWQAKGFWLYLMAMALWGFYYDVKNFGRFDFVGRHTYPDEHASSFGVLGMFSSLGYIFAPLLIGFSVGELIGWQTYGLAWIFILISFMFFLILLFVTKKDKADMTVEKRVKCNFLSELVLWEKVGKFILPVLILTMMLNVLDAFFWTIGPLFAEGLTQIRGFDGLFLTSYSLPSVMVGWFVGSFTARIGKKKTAYWSFITGCFILILIGIIPPSLFTIVISFLSSMFISMSWPAINGAYADYIDEAPKVEKEIEGLEDFFGNLGYVIGPAMAGFLADSFGNAQAFSVFGIIGVISGLVLLKLTPKSIIVKV